MVAPDMTYVAIAKIYDVTSDILVTSCMICYACSNLSDAFIYILADKRVRKAWLLRSRLFCRPCWYSNSQAGRRLGIRSMGTSVRSTSVSCRVTDTNGETGSGVGAVQWEEGRGKRWSGAGGCTGGARWGGVIMVRPSDQDVKPLKPPQRNVVVQVNHR